MSTGRPEASFDLSCTSCTKETARLLIQINVVIRNEDENPLVYCYLLVMPSICRVHCAESGEESSEAESVYSLKCHISHDVNHLHEGLKHVSITPFRKYSFVFYIK